MSRAWPRLSFVTSFTSDSITAWWSPLPFARPRALPRAASTRPCAVTTSPVLAYFGSEAPASSAGSCFCPRPRPQGGCASATAMAHHDWQDAKVLPEVGVEGLSVRQPHRAKVAPDDLRRGRSVAKADAAVEGTVAVGEGSMDVMEGSNAVSEPAPTDKALWYHHCPGQPVPEPVPMPLMVQEPLARGKSPPARLTIFALLSADKLPGQRRAALLHCLRRALARS
eukprot:4023119-Lingulodinium_polyedra.AAC.2